MTWDKKKVEIALKNISNQMKNAKSEQELSALKLDYFSLTEILKTLDMENFIKLSNENTKMNLKMDDLKDYYQQFYFDSFNSLITNQDILFEVARRADLMYCPKPKMMLGMKIDEKTYLDMIKEFFYVFDQEHYKIYVDLIDGNIHFAKRGSEVGDRAKGKCYHLLSTSDTFIITNFKDKRNIPTLPHEIGHGYELALLKNIIQRTCWHYSSFLECYPKFIELAFLDYYLKGKYGNYFLKLKYTFLDNLKATAEYSLTSVSNIKNYNISLEEFSSQKDLRLDKKYLDYIISDILALYLFHLYKNDREYFNVIIKKYHSYKGKSDELIWKLFSKEDLIRAFEEELNCFMQEVALSRIRK